MAVVAGATLVKFAEGCPAQPLPIEFELWGNECLTME